MKCSVIEMTSEPYPDIDLHADHYALSKEEKCLDRLQAWLISRFGISTLIASPDPAPLPQTEEQAAFRIPHLKKFLTSLTKSEVSFSHEARLTASQLNPALFLLYQHDGLTPPLPAALTPQGTRELDKLITQAADAGLRFGIDFGIDFAKLTHISMPDTLGGQIKVGRHATWEDFKEQAKERHFTSLHLLQDAYPTPFDACKRGLIEDAGLITRRGHEIGAFASATPSENGFLDATWTYDDPEKAFAAFTKICRTVPPLFAEYIPEAHLEIAHYLKHKPLPFHRYRQHGKTGIRLVYKGSILKARMKLAKASLIAELAKGVMSHTGPHLSDDLRRKYLLKAGAIELTTQTSPGWSMLEAFMLAQTRILHETAQISEMFLKATPLLAPRIKVIAGGAPILDYTIICPRDLKSPLTQWHEIIGITQAITHGQLEISAHPPEIGTLTSPSAVPPPAAEASTQ